MKIQHIYSATVIIESKGVKVLCDPWLVDGIYYGSWYQYPKVEHDWNLINSVDFIYVSHIHPDHLCKETFERIDKNIPVLIHKYDSRFLYNVISRWGFNVIELNHNEPYYLGNDMEITILAADNCDPEVCAKHFGCAVMESKYGSTQIDSLAIIADDEHAILNVNDCPYELAEAAVKRALKRYNIDFLLVGYAGAGPYPQCFNMDEETMEDESIKKMFKTMNRGVKFLDLVKPRYYMPFAGTYVLGGRLATKNDYLGIPELHEATAYFDDMTGLTPKPASVLLNPYESFDLSSGKPTNPYTPVDKKDKSQYIESLSKNKMDYELLPLPEVDEIWEKVYRAYQNMEKKRKQIGFESDTVVVIDVHDPYGDRDGAIVVYMNGNGVVHASKEWRKHYKKFVRYSLDTRLLNQILSGPKYAHWNNAEIGSHIEFEREPNVFERGLHHSMNFFHA